MLAVRRARGAVAEKRGGQAIRMHMVKEGRRKNKKGKGGRGTQACRRAFERREKGHGRRRISVLASEGLVPRRTREGQKQQGRTAERMRQRAFGGAACNLSKLPQPPAILLWRGDGVGRASGTNVSVRGDTTDEHMSRKCALRAGTAGSTGKLTDVLIDDLGQPLLLERVEPLAKDVPIDALLQRSVGGAVT